MQTRAAVLRKAGTPWEITELELDPPKANEVLIKVEAAGPCHSSERIRSRGRARLVGGHEGASVVVGARPVVTRVKASARVFCSYIPVFGACRCCSAGKQNPCDGGRYAGVGCQGAKMYALDEINEGYQDLMDGKNIRGRHSARAREREADS